MRSVASRVELLLAFVVALVGVVLVGSANTTPNASPTPIPRAYSYDLAAHPSHATPAASSTAPLATASTAMRGAVAVERVWSSAAKGFAQEDAVGSSAFHYTGSQNVASIESNGLNAGSYATTDGNLSPLQAQIDLALPPNRGLPGAVLRIDLEGLRAAGYDLPEVTRVGRRYNMPGGGTEMQFPYRVPPQFIKVVRQ